MGHKLVVENINNTYLYAITKEHVYTSPGLAFVKNGYIRRLFLTFSENVLGKELGFFA